MKTVIRRYKRNHTAGKHRGIAFFQRNNQYLFNICFTYNYSLCHEQILSIYHYNAIKQHFILKEVQAKNFTLISSITLQIYD